MGHGFSSDYPKEILQMHLDFCAVTSGLGYTAFASSDYIVIVVIIIIVVSKIIIITIIIILYIIIIMYIYTYQPIFS